MTDDADATSDRVAQALALVGRIRETYELDLAVSAEAQRVFEDLQPLVHEGGEAERSDFQGEAHYALGWLCWFRYIQSNRSNARAADVAREHFLICLVEGHGGKFPIALEADVADKAARYARSALGAAFENDDPEIADQAVTLWARVAGCTPESEPEYDARQYYWGMALLRSFELRADPQILDQAIRVNDRVVQRRPVYDVQHAATLIQAGKAWAALFEHRRRLDARARDQALQHLKAVLGLASAPARSRVEALRVAALLIMDTDPGKAAELLEQAVRTLPLVAPRHLPATERQDMIGWFPGLARLAAALHLHCGGGDAAATALQLLELGRGVLLGQEFSVRGDEGRLATAAPRLARRFSSLRDRLDEDLVEPPDDENDAASWQDARRRCALELDATLAEIRTLDGFASFGLPPTAEQLHAEAAQGPIVVLTTSVLRSDAIVVTARETVVVPLAGADEKVLYQKVNEFRGCLRSLTPTASLFQRRASQQQMRDSLGWLWDHVAAPVYNRLLAQRAEGESSALPHVRWVACGPFSLLPIHAAGRYDRPRAQTLAEHVISSYVPSIQALHHARRQSQNRNDDAPESAGSLLVAMPETPGATPLNAVAAEADRIRALLPSPTVLTSVSSKENRKWSTSRRDSQRPTKANVLSRLHGCSFAHFACHGQSDPEDPAESMLLLEDHATDPLTVRSIMPTVAEHGELAYLSACSTAFTSNADLLDEGIHLASAFQLVGFPRVVGTLWEVDDTVAADVAQHFYEALGDGGEGLHPERSAHALHHAVERIRERWPGNPDRWAPFVHVGT